MTPLDRERRAREEVLDLIVADRSVLVLKMPRVLDAYAEAVRQAERDRMARVVEQLDGYSHQFDPDNICMQPEDDGPYLLRDDVLTALAAPPEGKTDAV